MKRFRTKLLSAILAFVIAPVFFSATRAQMAPPPNVKVGLLSCVLSPTIGLVVGSLQTMDCRFTPDGPYPVENYTGTFGTLGPDIGVTLLQGLAWGVYAPSDGPYPGALAGVYVGPSAEVSAVLGLGANILIGGSNRSFALQPVSLSGKLAINISIGISTIVLKASG
jgi:hypothetical protein